jgi:hypothetical protein
MIIRVPQQCKSCCRFTTHADPTINHAAWTAEEEETLVTQHRKHGNQWVTIAESLSNRSWSQVRNQWHKISRRKARELSESNAPLNVPGPGLDQGDPLAPNLQDQVVQVGLQCPQQVFMTELVLITERTAELQGRFHQLRLMPPLRYVWM